MGRVTVHLDTRKVAKQVMRRGGGVDRVMRDRAKQVVRRAKDIAPRGATGRLRKSIDYDQTRTELGRFSFGYVIYADAPYAKYVHDGTGPHERSVRYAKQLATKRYGPWKRFGKTVMVPTRPAQPFLVEALPAALEDR